MESQLLKSLNTHFSNSQVWTLILITISQNFFLRFSFLNSFFEFQVAFLLIPCIKQRFLMLSEIIRLFISKLLCENVQNALGRNG